MLDAGVWGARYYAVLILLNKEDKFNDFVLYSGTFVCFWGL